MKRPTPDQLVLWPLLAAPPAVVLVLYARDAMSYGQVLHFTGDWSVRLLILALAVTPLRLMFPRAPAMRWALRRRRDVGVAAFGYAAFHLAAYLAHKMSPALILQEGKEADLATGWLAFLIFCALAATSNDAAVRALKRNWKRLHRMVYVAAVLAFAHWLMTAFELRDAVVHAGVLATLEAARILLQLKARLATASASRSS
ncbi:MAG TPA: ferric reductase-like transmembrane domain-containing protein [Caulobacteraceae bacterium]|nr:ferric reductase-like transmembrane domain-containing protein [Caulobacteraceae bacterium]